MKSDEGWGEKRANRDRGWPTVKFIEEVIADEFLPTFRSMLAADLRERGLTQAEVAEKLGISQSAVSKYAQGDVNRRQAVAEDERVTELVEEIGEGLATGDMRPVQALIEAEILIRRLSRGDDLLAALHEEAMPTLREVTYDFTLEETDSEALERERVLASVRRGLRILEHTSGFAGLIPNVGSNLVEGLPNGSTLEDVAGVPGRLFDVKGRTEIPAEPEFGVSEHVASVLLGARAAGSDARAALNIAYSPAIIDELSGMGEVVQEFTPDDEPAEQAVREAIAEEPAATVLYHRGAFGVEPIVYLLGDSASEVATSAGELV